MKKIARRRPTKHIPSSTDQLMQGISHHKHTDRPDHVVNVKLLPLELVQPDPKNARTMLVEEKDYIQISPISLPFDEAAQQTLQKQLEERYQHDRRKNEKIQEFFSIAQLAASIQNPEKLKQPVVVEPINDGASFRLQIGHRRRLAHLLLGAKYILAKIEDVPTDLEHALSQFKENNDREDLDLFSELVAIDHIITAWEKERNQTISITKLMALLSQKKTRSHWQLSVIRKMKSHQQFLKVLKGGYIDSLEIAYKLSVIDDQLIDQIAADLVAGKPLSLQNVNAKKQSVRSPNTRTDYGIVLTKETNYKLLTEMIRILMHAPELKTVAHTIDPSHFNSAKGLKTIWKTICHHLVQCSESEHLEK